MIDGLKKHWSLINWGFKHRYLSNWLDSQVQNKSEVDYLVNSHSCDLFCYNIGGIVNAFFNLLNGWVVSVDISVVGGFIRSAD